MKFPNAPRSKKKPTTNLASGLYDPIPDDSEDIYVPTGPNDIDEELNLLREQRNLQTESIESKESVEKSKTVPSESYRPFEAGNLEAPVVLNLNYKDVFPELNLEELPPQIKYKLPVSEHYDPEGKMAAQRRVCDKKKIIDYEEIKITANKQNDVFLHSKKVPSQKEVSDKSMFGIHEITKEQNHLNILEEETKLRKIKQTALHVIEDSLSKAVTVANELKGAKQSEFLQYKEDKMTSKSQKLSKQTEKKSFEQSKKEKIKSLTKKVSFEDDRLHEIENALKEACKREVHVADEIKKFETLDIQMDSKLNEEERKLLTQRDIEEAIEAGTVRQRTGMFKTGIENKMANKFEKKILETVKIDVKTNIEVAKQKAYNIGFQIIPRIRAAVQYSHQSSLILKRFLLQMTKVMIMLYKCIPKSKRYNYCKSIELYDEKKESHKYYLDEALKRDALVDERGEIKKPKLSGAKIAQIEGLKPAELTDRMNTVISEFLRKSGKEDITEEKKFHRRQSSNATTENKFMGDTSFRENTFDRNQTSGKISNDSPRNGNTFRDKIFDSKNMFEETYESETQTYDIREIKEEKHYTESKSSEFNANVPSSKTESTTKNDGTVPLTYIAIVEAHVYTNKNAIFEEQMRRKSESMKQSDISESGIIYYRCEVSVFYRHFREPSLPPTVVIESIEEIPSEQVFEAEEQEILQTNSTIYEDSAKKLAVQKISEVIEPLLRIKEVRSINIKQAYPAIEKPLKLAFEQTSEVMEKEKSIVQESKLLKDLSRITMETPLKQVSENTEIKQEEKRGLVEILQTDEQKPRPIIEPTTISIAETSEVFIAEETVGMVHIPQPIAQLPQPVKVERLIKSVAETSEVIVDEASVEIMDATKDIRTTPRYTIADNLRTIAETMTAIIQEPEIENKDVSKVNEEKVEIGVDEIIASEEFEILPEEPVYQEVTQTETNRRQSEIFLEKSILILPEITLTAAEEPICEELVVSKVQSKEAKVDVDLKVAAEVTEITISENEQDSFDVVTVTVKEPDELKEETVFSVGETETILPYESAVEPLDPSKLKYHQAFVAIEESKATETTITQIEEPQDKKVDLLKFMEKNAQAVTEDKLLIVAENTIILSEEPHHGYLEITNLESKRPKKLIEGGLILAETTEVSPTSIEEGFNLTETINKNAYINIEESKAITTSLVHIEEPKEEQLDLLQFREMKSQASLQDTSLTVPMIVEISPEGPRDENLIIAKPVEVKADIDIEELKTASVTIVPVEEPKNENIDNFTYTEKESESSLDESVLYVAEKFTTVPIGPLYDIIEPLAITHDKANINVEEIKPLMVNIVTPNEPQVKAVDIPKVIDIKAQSLLEDHFLPVVETISVVPESKIDAYVVNKTRDEQANINIEMCKTAETTMVTIGEPNEDNFEVPKYEEKQPVALTEISVFTVPKIVEIIPDEPKDSFTVPSVMREQADVRIRELKGTHTTIIYTEEPKEENFKSPTVDAKNHQTVLEGIHLTAAETSLILSEESSASFDVTKTTSQLANIKVIEQKAAEATIIFPLESKEKDVIIPDILEKIPQTLFESPLLTAAENSVTVFEEKLDKLEQAIKPVAHKASVYIEGLKVASTNILFLEEGTPANIEVPKLIKKEPKLTFVDNYFALAEIIFICPSEQETEFTVFSKSIMNQAKVLIEETEAAATANITSVSVTVAKEEILDVSKYTVELAEEHSEKAAALKLTVDIEDVDLSSPSSTISSAPSSPFIQEYVFGTAIGHEYRVQSPQETSLDIIQRAKELHGFDSADTSYTLTFEAAYEDEIEVLHMEEFGDVIKNNKFWISDVKTIETLESSDARIHLINLQMGVLDDTRKSKSKSIYVQDSGVEIKSRSPSFDTTADFEVSLQSSIQSKASETQISDVQVAVTFDLKSEASFKTVEDVESDAKVNIKTKSLKSYSAQSVDVAYGLTIENEIEVNRQSMETQDTKIAKSSTRRVKKGAKEIVQQSSEIDIQASYSHESDMNLESKVYKESHATLEETLESSRISEANYLAKEETMQAKLESSSDVKVGSSYMEMDSSLQSRSISQGSFTAIEEDSASLSSFSSKQASIESKGSIAIEMDSNQQKGLTAMTQVGTKMDGQQKLSLEIDLKGTRRTVTNDPKSPSPEDIPSSPLRDVYIFRLHTPAPEETTFIPRDCSFTPESVHEEPIVPVKGMIPHIDTKIVRVLYSPPLDTPPSSPWRKIEPIFTKPGLKGGSETPEFTKEEILEIGRKSALLASAIDKTIRSIEEYKESVGISNTKDIGDTEEGELCEKETHIENKGAEENETKPTTFDKSSKIEITKKDDKKSPKTMPLLSRFSQI